MTPRKQDGYLGPVLDDKLSKGLKCSTKAWPSGHGRGTEPPDWCHWVFKAGKRKQLPHHFSNEGWHREEGIPPPAIASWGKLFPLSQGERSVLQSSQEAGSCHLSPLLLSCRDQLMRKDAYFHSHQKTAFFFFLSQAPIYWMHSMRGLIFHYERCHLWGRLRKYAKTPLPSTFHTFLVYVYTHCFPDLQLLEGKEEGTYPHCCGNQPNPPSYIPGCHLLKVT